MSLRERLSVNTPATVVSLANMALPNHEASTMSPEAMVAAARTYQALKSQLHQLVLRRLDVEAMERMSPERLREELRMLVEQLLQEESIALNAVERRNLVAEIQDEMLGLGPLEPLLADPTVSDILVNTAQQVYVERKGRLELTSVAFADNAHLMKIIEKIVSRVGRRVDESSPMVDARLPDLSLIHI